MSEENLNIDFHRKELLLKVLNKIKDRDEQAKKLGVTKRTINNFMKRFNVQKLYGEYVAGNN